MQLVDNETVLGHSSGQAALTDEVCHVLPLLNEAWWSLLGAATVQLFKTFSSERLMVTEVGFMPRPSSSVVRGLACTAHLVRRVPGPCSLVTDNFFTELNYIIPDPVEYGMPPFADNQHDCTL